MSLSGLKLHFFMISANAARSFFTYAALIEIIKNSVIIR